MICDKRPEQLKMEFALRNWAAVMQLIEREYGVKLSVRGVGNYLARRGYPTEADQESLRATPGSRTSVSVRETPS